MMNFTVKPISAAKSDAAEIDGFVFDAPLLRAFEGEADPYLYGAIADQYRGRPVYCGKAVQRAKRRLLCLIDDDRDGQFEGYSVARGQGGSNPLNATIMGPVLPMKSAAGYTVMAGPDLPSFKVTMTNCGKDWDRPHYAMNVDDIPAKNSEIDINALLAATAGSDRQTRMQLQRLLGGQTPSAPCEQGDRLYSVAGIDPVSVPKSGILAEVDAFIFAVGKKTKETSLQLRSVQVPDRLYRVEGRGLVPLSVGLSYNQRDLLTAQRFDKPFLMAKGGLVSSPGIKTVDDVILEFDIEHGYIGKLTSEISIRTLLSSRSLDAGTVVYGVPMQTSRTLTINGIPQNLGRPTRPSREINTRLVWCAPVRDEDAIRDEDRHRIGTSVSYTDSCISDQGGVQHTILKGRTPSFQVSSFGYDANTATNDGPVPVERSEGDFGAPLKMRFIVAGIWSNAIHLKRQIYIGDELASEKLEYLRRAPNRESVLTLAGTTIRLSAPTGSKDQIQTRERKSKNWNVEEAVTVVVEGDLKAGDSVRSRTGLGKRESEIRPEVNSKEISVL